MSVSISGPLPKERRLAAHTNPEMSRTVMRVAVMYKGRVVDHISLAISKCISLFLTLLGWFLETKVTGKRTNRGGGYGLKVPCKYCISGQEKDVDWIKRKLTTFLQEHSLAVNKCLGKKYKLEKIFMCLLYGGRLRFKCSCETWK